MARNKHSPLYRLWLSINNRCWNDRTGDYWYYGGRGIKVCKRWQDYDNFAADVGPHPGNGLTFDRIDNDGHYKPGNVRWATRTTQSRNRPAYVRLSVDIADKIRSEYRHGKVRQVDIAAKYGVTQNHVSKIVRRKLWK